MNEMKAFIKVNKIREIESLYNGLINVIILHDIDLVIIILKVGYLIFDR
jgi:hypothetical protein